jgi:DNA-binding NtrC family response regulator
MASILIVEDEALLRWSLHEQLTRAGHTVHASENLAAASNHLERHQPDVLLLDLSLPDGHGLHFYQQHRLQLEHTVVIVMTAVGQIEDAVRAMKLGALDFLNKPIDRNDLVHLIDRSVLVRGEQLELQAARQSRERDFNRKLVGKSAAFLEFLRVAEDVARSRVNSILLQGESGTGKNVLVRHIHAVSSRRDKPLLEVSCAAIPDQLLESELLGHERGSFTDAKTTRRGSFELANGGTIALDEIGELKLELQAKLLDVLEERRVRRIGGSREILIDVRVIALTNRDVPTMVRSGEFREDLFYRLNVFPITVPPLRERTDDILPLARHFLDSLQAKFGRSFDGFSRDAETLLRSYSWPGNVRELRNVIERAMILERGDRLVSGSLILDYIGQAKGVDSSNPDSWSQEIVPLDELEIRMITRAMNATGGNQTRAAELLGITRTQLRGRLKKYDSLLPNSKR